MHTHANHVTVHKEVVHKRQYNNEFAVKCTMGKKVKGTIIPEFSGF